MPEARKRLHLFLTAFTTAASLPLLCVASSLFDLSLELFAQVSTPRAWATLCCFSAVMLAFGLVAAAGRLAWPRPLPAAAGPWLQGALATIATWQLAQIGVLIVGPMAQNFTLEAVVFLAAGAALLRIWLFGPEPRALIAQGLVRAGFVAVCLPWLWTPAIVQEYRLFTSRPAHASAPKDAPAAADVRPGAPRHVVLLVLDSTSYLSTSLHDPARNTTPHLRALAAESTWFTQCRTAGERTLFSMPTVLSGIRPDQYRMRVRNPSFVVREGLLTGLGALLEPAGYQAAYMTMLVDPGHVGLKWEFDQGCTAHQVFHQNLFATRDFIPLRAVEEWLHPTRWVPGMALSSRERTCGREDDDRLEACQATLQQGLTHLSTASSRTFTWIHLGAPHSPFIQVPPSDFDRPRPADSYLQVTEDMLRAATPEQLPRYRAVYETYLRFADHQLGRFVAGLKAAGRWDDTLMIVMADHGEGFRPGARGHDDSALGEEVTRIPLLIHRPGQRHEARRTDLVSSEDITPTILDAVYRKPHAGLEGHSLLQPARKRREPLLTWGLEYAWDRPDGMYGALAAFEWPYKYYVRMPERKEALYRLDLDPEGLTDVSSQAPGPLKRLRDHVTNRLKRS